MGKKFAVRTWSFDAVSYKLGEPYLEEMAKNGLLLRKISRGGLACYEKIEKGTRLQFHIDARDVPGAFKTYTGEWEDAGWHYICSNRNYHYFSADQGVQPLPSDPEARRELLKFDFWITRGLAVALLFVLLLFLANVTQKAPTFFFDQTISPVWGFYFRTSILVLWLIYAIKSIFDYCYFLRRRTYDIPFYMSLKNFLRVRRFLWVIYLLLILLSIRTLSPMGDVSLVYGLLIALTGRYINLFPLAMAVLTGTRKKISIIVLAVGLLLLFTGATVFFVCAQQDLTDIPKVYTLEDAKADGFVVFENLDITSGQAEWAVFTAEAEAGNPCEVRLAFYYTLGDTSGYSPEYYEEIKDDYPVMYIQDLRFDGEIYTLYSYDEKEEYRYQYLKRLVESTPPPSAIYTKRVWYVLVNDNNVTGEQILRGTLSSQSGDYIDYKTVYSRYSYKSDAEKSEPYSFTGETYIEVDGRSISLEDIPESYAEDAVVKSFLYDITGEMDKKYNIVADLPQHVISIENKRKDIEDDCHMQSYTIHQIITLSEEQYAREWTDDPMEDLTIYLNYQTIIDQYKLKEYEIINVTYTQIWSQKQLELGPQWGNGTYSRNFIVGKAEGDASYMIYDYAMPYGVE